ncbi:non-hydrolyzing UDP-N-acetylglucosamine 2-epimerase [Streptococcus sp. H31]|uniref:non-hydrolyzing UDP-N-acetylglucosamine 2-epimerase n=1 Tax=Streptococcus huangxiaojuni TaxID=3237239 RepID=UPI0034A4D36E
MKKVKVMLVFGTRPEAIKMAPLVHQLKKQNDFFETIVVVTGQHREMLDQVLKVFAITADYDLDIMEANQGLTDITANIFTALDPVLKESRPDLVLVHGDTTTTFAAATAAFYNQIKVGHVEAGLRTWDKYSPFPEEMNRQLTDAVADLYFAPTEESRRHLLKENRPEETIFVTGNTAIDVLSLTVKDGYRHQLLDSLSPDRKMILVTMHRRENQGKPMQQVFRALREIADSYDDIDIVYPVHLSPAVQKTAQDFLSGHDKIHLIAPLDVADFHNFAARSYFIMSDSGGVQEEAPSLGKPVLVLRDRTERPEGVSAGTLKLVGTEGQNIKKAVTELLTDSKSYQRMAQAANPYGDGDAAKRITQAIAFYFGLSDNRPLDFGIKES